MVEVASVLRHPARELARIKKEHEVRVTPKLRLSVAKEAAPYLAIAQKDHVTGEVGEPISPAPVVAVFEPTLLARAGIAAKVKEGELEATDLVATVSKEGTPGEMHVIDIVRDKNAVRRLVRTVLFRGNPENDTLLINFGDRPQNIARLVEAGETDAARAALLDANEELSSKLLNGLAIFGHHEHHSRKHTLATDAALIVATIYGVKFGLTHAPFITDLASKIPPISVNTIFEHFTGQDPNTLVPFLPQIEHFVPDNLRAIAVAALIFPIVRGVRLLQEVRHKKRFEKKQRHFFKDFQNKELIELVLAEPQAEQTQNASI